MSVLEALLGRRLASQETRAQRVGAVSGVAVFGLDALGSAAYGPEAALTVLLSAGLLGLRYILPISGVVIALLLVVYLSYWQTIGSYPNGGGAYTVARQNLGPRVGMFAGAALMLDYLLNVAVGISTGVGALVSALPRLQPHVLALCLSVLAIVVLANLRGLRESGFVWLIPTYAFIVSLGIVVIAGIAKVHFAHDHVQSPGRSIAAVGATTGVTPWLVIRAFAAGCTALTGVEAVSNGVNSFNEPRRRRARVTLTIIVGTLAALLMGISYLARSYGIVAKPPAQPGYESILSMVTRSVMGPGTFYYFSIASILCVLSLSANTSFAGFPQLCRVMAEDGYLPRSFAIRGRRLVYTFGIVVLGVLAAIVLIAFGGVTDRLIPLFAIGAFLAFTSSQAGMVEHWRRSDARHASWYAGINALGACATALTVLVVLVAKFTAGAWLSVVLIGLTVWMLSSVRLHYDRVERITHISKLKLEPLPRLPMMLVPVSHWNRASMAAVQLACSLSDDVRILHIGETEEECEQVRAAWTHDLEEASRNSGILPPCVIPICSPYRLLSGPLLDYVEQAERESPDRKITVVIAEVVAAHWYHHVMHNYRTMLLRLRLFLLGNRRVVIMDVPWQLPFSAT